MRYHFLRDNVEKGNISLIHVPTQDQLTDIFTKPLDQATLAHLRGDLGVWFPFWVGSWSSFCSICIIYAFVFWCINHGRIAIFLSWCTYHLCISRMSFSYMLWILSYATCETLCRLVVLVWYAVMLLLVIDVYTWWDNCFCINCEIFVFSHELVSIHVLLKLGA